MSELADQLRALHEVFGEGRDVLLEAADRIEVLERELARSENVDDRFGAAVDLAGRTWRMP